MTNQTYVPTLSLLRNLGIAEPGRNVRLQVVYAGDARVQRRPSGSVPWGQNIPMKRSQFLKSAGAAFVIPAVWPWAPRPNRKEQLRVVPSETPVLFPWT